MIQPTGSHVLLQMPPAPAPVSEIIHLPEDTQLQVEPKGVCVAVGPDVVDITPGDTCHVERFDWCYVEEDRIIVAEEEVLAVEKTTGPKCDRTNTGAWP